MFKSLGEKLSSVFSKLTSVGYITEDHINTALREIRVALLEADVSLEVVREFTKIVKEKALGSEVIKSVSPGQMVVKIVQDTIADLLTYEGGHELSLKSRPPAVILMMGLQGSGKTTTSAKIAKKLSKSGKKVLLASSDIYRPAAREQLKLLGEKVGVDALPIIENEKVDAIIKRSMDLAQKESYDVLILDTAGRTHIDESMMDEISKISKVVKPVEKLLVVDSMIGQESVNVAKEFHSKVGCTGIALTRVDGDTRGGAALSMSFVTDCPIKILGVGEGVDEIEDFDPERIASRILGMGDVVSLVEKAAEAFDEDEAKKIEQEMAKGQFNIDQLASHLSKIKKMGGVTKLLGMIPGMGKLTGGQINGDEMDDKAIDRQIAIIRSMTKYEKLNPKILNASRKNRIAAGSGTKIQDVNKLIKNFLKMQKMMKKFSGMDKKSIMRGGMDQFLN